MKQRVFGSHRTIGPELILLAGPAAENFEAVYPYDPSRKDARWLDFVSRYEARYQEKPDHFAALAYDQMRILLDAICRAGLNRGRIRDALTAITSYKGVTADMVFDPNCKNIAPLFLARVHNGEITYHKITMEKPYAQVTAEGGQYLGPATGLTGSSDRKIAVFGPHADDSLLRAGLPSRLAQLRTAAESYSLVPIRSDSAWGKASSDLVKAVYEDHVLAVIALDRQSSHLAEQIAVKSFIPVIAISSDQALTTTNIPWIFRVPEGTSLQTVLDCLSTAIDKAGPSRSEIRGILASGAPLAGIRFSVTGDAIQAAHP